MKKRIANILKRLAHKEADKDYHGYGPMSDEERRVIRTRYYKQLKRIYQEMTREDQQKLIDANP